MRGEIDLASTFSVCIPVVSLQKTLKFCDLFSLSRSALVGKDIEFSFIHSVIADVLQMSGRVAVATLLVFIGCCTNVILLELLVKAQPGCTNLITFAQFLFTALEGFVFTAKFGTKKSIVPLRHYVALVVMFFVVSVANNLALSYDISMPLHMIFKSGSLIATMLLGMLLLQRRYPLSKYIAVSMITVGIILCTYASVRDVPKQKDRVVRHNDSLHTQFIGVILLSLALLLSARMGIYQERLSTVGIILCTYASVRDVPKQKDLVVRHNDSLHTQFIGVILLSLALLLSARMGIYQESLSARFGKHPRESLFYVHALPLPGFLLLSSDILHQAHLFHQSAPLEMGLLGSVPSAWMYLFLNVITQYVCIRSVYVLTTECSSLTVTLIITLRKFISLLLSIFYFQNPFTLLHWAGTFLVFLGTLLFTHIFDSLATLFTSKALKVE
uniref:Ribonuclease Oy n=1 Tax=Ornithodoros moubata TaxID=6938 RepID=A0A1Z5L212_ORNMO